ncbi:hypothetical protein CEXT_788001 [Caerostris extrusa]|uniref:Uncharacterized protein n=1 Tax=Caerostris extrusa TaxID=172846 RepID=A0AAV4NQ50_CAEEX|nr:hypothetical protein CEXT_788001 [Caerostris extrusa]
MQSTASLCGIKISQKISNNLGSAEEFLAILGENILLLISAAFWTSDLQIFWVLRIKRIDLCAEKRWVLHIGYYSVGYRKVCTFRKR